MGYRTVNLRPSTFERLKMYQTAGKSLSDVVDRLMDEVEPERLYRKELRIARRRLKEMTSKGVGVPLRDLESKLERGRE